MVFYLDVRGQDINEFLAENCDYIGILGSKNEDVKNITKEDISLDKINEHQEKNEFLVALIMNSTWWVCILFNADGAKEYKEKYKGKPTLWYWVSRDVLKFCMHHMQYKEFLREFPEKEV